MTCVLLGLAPHLDRLDLSLLDGLCEIFVCNRFYKSFPDAPFCPSYYVCSDRRVWRRECEEVSRRPVVLMLGDVLFDEKCPLHNWVPGKAGRKSDPEGRGPAPQPHVPWYGFKTVHRTNDLKFGYDPEYGFWNGGTVIYDALQWAVFMGYRNIGILGVDLEWPMGKEPTHAGGIHGQDHGAFPVYTDYSLKFFVHAASLLKKKGIGVFNLAPKGVGRLDSFRRMSLEDFANKQNV